MVGSSTSVSNDAQCLNCAEAEATAQRRQRDEDAAYGRFVAVRARIEAQGRGDDPTRTDEFRQWIASRRETDAAWGVWAMAMDAKPAV